MQFIQGCLIPRFRREAGDICALHACYKHIVINYYRRFGQKFGPIFESQEFQELEILTLENGTRNPRIGIEDAIERLF